MHHLDNDLKLWRRLLEISVRFHVAVHWNGPESVVERLEISSWHSNFIGRSIRIEADDWPIEHEMTGNSIRLYYQLFYGLLMTDDCSQPESSFHFVGILGDLCLFMSRVEEVMSRYISVFNDAICCSFPLPVSIPSERIHFRKRTSEHFVKYHQRVFRRAIPKIRAVYLRASPRVESTTVVFQWPSGRPRAVTVFFFCFPQLDMIPSNWMGDQSVKKSSQHCTGTALDSPCFCSSASIGPVWHGNAPKSLWNWTGCYYRWSYVVVRIDR